MKDKIKWVAAHEISRSGVDALLDQLFLMRSDYEEFQDPARADAINEALKAVRNMIELERLLAEDS